MSHPSTLTFLVTLMPKLQVLFFALSLRCVEAGEKKRERKKIREIEAVKSRRRGTKTSDATVLGGCLTTSERSAAFTTCRYSVLSCFNGKTENVRATDLSGAEY